MDYNEKILSRFVLFISIVQSILFLGHWFLYRTLVRFFGVAFPAPLWSLRVVLAVLSVSLVLTSLLSYRYADFPVRLLYTLSVGWLGVCYLLIIATAMAWLICGTVKVAHLSIDRRLLMETLIGMALLTCLYGFFNAAVVRTTRIHVRLPGLPAQWKGKTAVWISDIHLGHVRNDRFVRGIVAMIQGLRPDMVFVGGDLFDGVAIDPDKAIEPFSELSPPYGTYFVTGNHEQFRDSAAYLQAVRRAGMRVLNNEIVELDGLQLAGVDYRDSRNRKQFREILRSMKIDRRKPTLLLKHAPFDPDVARDEGISLQLSGHTHRGQVFLFRFITSRVYQGYDYGLKSLGDLLIYTSSGAGTWGPPMRVDTIPEIVVITLD
jgi:predicted MPP superfamily phosphohydrolase